MDLRRSRSMDGVAPGEPGARRRSPGWWLRWNVLAGAAAGILAVATVESCKATRHPDGSVSVEVALDRLIATHGLEDALRQLRALYDGCLSGSWNPPCTTAERAEIQRVIDIVLQRKGSIAGSS